MEKMREEFEKWYLSRCGYLPNQYKDGRYVPAHARDTWEAWKAATEVRRTNETHN